MTSVRLDHVSKRFGDTIAVSDVTLDIHGGELFFLLGPSGCGKSTLLRMVAGLLEPSRGKILFDDRDVTQLPTEQRNAVMCFQSYALWPHMSVRANLRFGLDVRKVPRDQQDQKIAEVLALVQMQSLADRKPNELSGGQQQRVALARAMVVRPACLLLDEPLSNLDAKLRGEMRSEIRRICKASGLTTIYVTHDQKEALSMADRVAIMLDGKVVQVGAPGELYNRPASAFVAEFLGSTNLLRGRVIEQNHQTARIETAVGEITARTDSLLTASQAVMLSIRPEQLRIARGESAQNRLAARLIETTFLGEASEHTLQVNEQRLKLICTPPMFDFPPTLNVEFAPEDVVILADEVSK